MRRSHSSLRVRGRTQTRFGKRRARRGRHFRLRSHGQNQKDFRQFRYPQAGLIASLARGACRYVPVEQQAVFFSRPSLIRRKYRFTVSVPVALPHRKKLANTIASGHESLGFPIAQNLDRCLHVRETPLSSVLLYGPEGIVMQRATERLCFDVRLLQDMRTTGLPHCRERRHGLDVPNISISVKWL